jgi:regulator of sirC expression with transglutaminase-like and TPR domain
VDPTARFAQLIAHPSDVPLDEAMLLIAAHADPTADVAAARQALDELAGACRPGLDGLLHELFTVRGFRGNEDDYYDPRNSLLHEVIARRVGIPISLSVVTLEVGRRVGVALEPVAMPGHFLLRAVDTPGVFVDSYSGGAVLDRDGCAAIFERLHPAVPFHDEVLTPVPTAVVLVRTLGNLAGIYRTRRDRRNLAWVLGLRALLPAMPAAERRELAATLAARGQFDEAATALEALDGADDRTAAQRLRARLN